MTDVEIRKAVLHRLCQFDNLKDRVAFIVRLTKGFCRECGVMNIDTDLPVCWGCSEPSREA